MPCDVVVELQRTRWPLNSTTVVTFLLGQDSGSGTKRLVATWLLQRGASGEEIGD
jgi:hypothetical protein